MEGQLRPLTIEFDEEHKYSVDRVLDVCRAACQTVGGVGTRYTVRVQGQERYLWLEKGAKISSSISTGAPMANFTIIISLILLLLITMSKTKREKRYVPVVVRFDTEGQLRPLTIEFDEEHKFAVYDVKNLHTYGSNGQTNHWFHSFIASTNQRPFSWGVFYLQENKYPINS